MIMLAEMRALMKLRLERGAVSTASLCQVAAPGCGDTLLSASVTAVLNGLPARPSLVAAHRLTAVASCGRAQF